MQSWLALSALSLAFSLTLGLSSCRKAPPQQSTAPIAPPASAENSTAAQLQPAPTEPAPPAKPDTAAAPQTDSSANPPQVNIINITPLSAQSARLTSRDPDSQINVRSQPTTKSSAPSYGLPNDPVTLLEKAQGDEGYSWYYVQFDQSNIEGWIREDFIDASGGVAASRRTTLDSQADSNAEASCSPRDQIALFETENYTVNICRREGGIQYIGVEKGTANSIVIDEVEGLENGFVATSGDTEYIVNPNSLMIYQMQNGEYIQLSEESVIKAERF